MGGQTLGDMVAGLRRGGRSLYFGTAWWRSRMLFRKHDLFFLHVDSVFV